MTKAEESEQLERWIIGGGGMTLSEWQEHERTMSPASLESYATAMRMYAEERTGIREIPQGITMSSDQRSDNLVIFYAPRTHESR